MFNIKHALASRWFARAWDLRMRNQAYPRVVNNRLARCYGGQKASSPGDCGDARRSWKRGIQFAKN